MLGERDPISGSPRAFFRDTRLLRGAAAALAYVFESIWRFLLYPIVFWKSRIEGLLGDIGIAASLDFTRRAFLAFTELDEIFGSVSKSPQ